MVDRRPHQAHGAHEVHEVHGAHDLELVARAAAGDASAPDAVRAAELRAACPACAVLDADLRVIVAATRALRGSNETTRAPRDFQLTVADAARLRPNDLVSRIAALFGGARLTRSRAGAGLMAFGLVGMLLASGLPGPLFSSLGVADGGAMSATKAQASPESAFAPSSTNARALDSATSPGDFVGNGATIAPGPTPSSSGPPFLGGASMVALVVGAWLLIVNRREHRSGR